MPKQEKKVAIVKKVSTDVVVAPNPAILDALRAEYPVEEGFKRTMFPRLGMFSQDVLEGKGKDKKVAIEAGTFFTDRESEEETENEEGKMVKEWVKTELGTEVEAIILFQRKQLRHFDESTEVFTSSPIFDDNEEIVPLFANKTEIARGTPAELKARPEYQIEKDGKIKSSLEDNKILYVLYEGEIYQMNLRGSSMYSFLTYARKTLIPSVVTKFTSEAKEKGKVEWNMMNFEAIRQLSQPECEDILEKVKEIKEAISQEKMFFAAKNADQVKAEDDLKNL